jgi:aspartyl-tRNA(Asn)/glutamyl-tRNA(Gln) amidotransferase subunit A
MRWSRRAFTRAGMAGGALGGLVGGSREAVRVAEGSTELTRLSLVEAAELVRTRKASPVELTRASLARIEAMDSRLNAFITVTAESALREAHAAEDQIGRGGWRGPLHGIPIALKDLVDTAGVRTTAASNVFRDRVPAEDAEIVRRLKQAGAVLLGKLNLHEFAYGASTVVSAFGPVRNPWSPERTAGGSSAGSAAAVAAELCCAAIGTDTGGSIREPAGFCGVVGLKPTFGRVSTRGVVPLAWSLDHVGPMTRRVRDAAAVLQVIAGYDARDTASVDVPVPDYSAAPQAAGALRLGVPRAHFYEALAPEVEAAVQSALTVLARLGGRTRDFVIDVGTDAAVAVLRAEAYAYHEATVARCPELYQPETLTRLRGGADVTASAYILARRKLEALRRSVRAVFDDVDLIVTPTTPVAPPPIDELQADTAKLRARELLMLRNTRPWNALGLPAVSVPCGFTSDGLPIGLQITGAPFDEARVLALAHAYEHATEWHARRPALL